jgi:hypothetical protein
MEITSMTAVEADVCDLFDIETHIVLIPPFLSWKSRFEWCICGCHPSMIAGPVKWFQLTLVISIGEETLRVSSRLLPTASRS